MGDNGLFDRTSKSKENAVLAQEKDQITMAWDALVYDQTTELISEDISEENWGILLQEELTKNGNNTTTELDVENAFYVVTFGKTQNTYLVDLNGNIILKDAEKLDYWVTYIFGDESFNGYRCLNTDIKLFNETNFNRDFEISMDVSNFTYLSGQDSNRNVLLCNQNENESPYQGFAFQYRDGALKIQANNTGIADYQQPWGKTSGNIVFKRISNVLYRDDVLLCDFADNIIPYNLPLSLGANLDQELSARRFSKVDLSNISVKMKYNHREYTELCQNLPAPEKSGNIFMGWYSAPEGGTHITTTEQLEAAKGKIYPHWIEDENAITVTFASNDGTGRSIKQVIPYNSLTQLDLNTFSKDGANFLSWNTSENGTGTKYLDGANVTLKDNITLYAQWLSTPRTTFTANNLTFTGNVSEIVDTGVCLFSAENIHKNFEMYLELDNVLTTNTNQATIMNTKDEAGGSPWPGIVFRYDSKKLLLKADSTSSNSKKVNNNIDAVQKLRIIRINDITYYSINDEPYQVLMNFSNIVRTFDSPVAFGGIVKPDGKRDRPLKGKLTTVSVKFISDNATLEEYQNALP